MRAIDWTTDPKTGASNSSEEFTELVDTVARILRNGSTHLDPAWAASTARLVMAQLAHVHGLSPGTTALQCCLCWLTDRGEADHHPACMVVNGLSVCAPHAVYCQSGPLATALQLLRERKGEGAGGQEP